MAGTDKRVDHLGDINPSLKPCPSRPSCVCSQQEVADSHYIKPLRYAVSDAQAWQILEEIVSQLPRAQVVQLENEKYMRVKVRSKMLRFVDVVEFLMLPEKEEIALRSASRLSYYDFGVNRARMEKIRSAFDAKIHALP